MFCLPGYIPTYVYIIVPIVIILLLIGCCCCVKKCCCKKSSSKRTGSEASVQYQRPVSVSLDAFVVEFMLVFFISVFLLQDQTQPSVAYARAPAPTPISYQPARPVAPAGPAPPFFTDPPVCSWRGLGILGGNLSHFPSQIRTKWQQSIIVGGYDLYMQPVVTQTLLTLSHGFLPGAGSGSGSVSAHSLTSWF